MNLTLITDILFRDAPDPEALRRIVARRFDVPLHHVYLRTMGDVAATPPDPVIQLTREPESIPGDFDAWYHLAVSADLVPRVGDQIGDVARELGTVVGTEADDERAMVLHLPDGTRHTVTLFEGDDDALRFTPAIHALIRRHPASSPAVAS